MQADIARPGSFFRVLHPEGATSGNVVLERKFGNRSKRSQVLSRELENISRSASKVPDIFFSTASFSGQVLLLNFNRTRCLHLQVPKSFPDIHIILSLRLGNIGIPLPTAVISDEEHVTLFWVLDTPIESHEFWLYSLLQRQLYSVAEEFNPPATNLDVAFLTRMPGSINSRNSKIAGIISYSGKTHSRLHIQRNLLSANTAISINEYRKLQDQAGITRELLTLLGNRWFSVQNPASYVYWLMFFGAALCDFCSPYQLESELTAIAESLENKPWSQIRNDYLAPIKSICINAPEGYIEYNGVLLCIDDSNWLSMLREKLQVTSREIRDLDLQAIVQPNRFSPHINCQISQIYPIGAAEFIPLERLLLRAS